MGAGLALSRQLGIDDLMTSLWIGAVLMSVSMWTIDWAGKQKWWPKESNRQTMFKIAVFGSYYGVAALGLIWTKAWFVLGNTLWGIDKIILGIVVGSLAFLAVEDWYQKTKTKNGKAHFPFEKVVLPVVALVILSIIAYFITKN